MKVNSILDIFGAIILLALATTLIRNPAIVGSTFGGFDKALKTAKG